MNFQDLWNKCFLLFLGRCVIKKKNLCIRRDGNWKKGCVGCRWDGQKSLGRQCPFLFVCVCLWGGGWAEGENQASNVALQAK